MKIRKEYVVLISIIIALCIYLILRTPDRTNYQLPKLPEIAGKDISKIEIQRPGASIVLIKKDDAWHFVPQGYLANANEVRNILDTIGKLTLTALVSEKKDYNRYDLNDKKKVIVRAWTGETLAREFEVGKPATSYKHTFVKLAGDDRVYHARGNFSGRFAQKTDSLRDKTVLSFEPAGIREIHITKGKQLMTFSRKELPVEDSTAQKVDDRSPADLKTKTVWESSDGKKADESRLNRLISTLSGLRCDQYIDGQKKGDFTGPIYSIQLEGAKKYSLSIFAKTDKDSKTYSAISSENDYPFLLQSRQAEQIMENPGKQ